MVPGASLQAHISPASQRNPPEAEPPEVSNPPLPPGVTQEGVPSSPGAKDPLTGTAAERYRDFLPLPLSDMFNGWTGRPETIGGGEEHNEANDEGGSRWERHPG